MERMHNNTTAVINRFKAEFWQKLQSIICVVLDSPFDMYGAHFLPNAKSLRAQAVLGISWDKWKHWHMSVRRALQDQTKSPFCPISFYSNSGQSDVSRKYRMRASPTVSHHINTWVRSLIYQSQNYLLRLAAVHSVSGKAFHINPEISCMQSGCSSSEPWPLPTVCCPTAGFRKHIVVQIPRHIIFGKS